jgi:N6-L-threonylcarbamoyladenine synthase
MRVLGIETSCDETAVAIYDAKQGLMHHIIHSQTKTHTPYGGVVPELASRDHAAKIVSVLDQTLKEAQIPLNSLDGIAYTAGPGLIGALMVGAACAKALGYALKIPTIAIHHMEGHLMAALLEKPDLAFPFLALLVSGGHTQLVEVQGLGNYQILGESLDDAAGEAFDKMAKILGLGLPGGPELAKLANLGRKTSLEFPRPLADRPDLNFSFSGLKTYAMNCLKNSTQTLEEKANIAYAFQEAVVDTLIIKCRRALKQTDLTRLVVAGGVSANLRLREKLSELQKTQAVEIFYPKIEFCTDNAAMIAFTGSQRLIHEQDKTLEILVQPRWTMDTLSNQCQNK